MKKILFFLCVFFLANLINCIGQAPPEGLFITFEYEGKTYTFEENKLVKYTRHTASYDKKKEGEQFCVFNSPSPNTARVKLSITLNVGKGQNPTVGKYPVQDFDGSMISSGILPNAFFKFSHDDATGKSKEYESDPKLPGTLMITKAEGTFIEGTFEVTVKASIDKATAKISKGSFRYDFGNTAKTSGAATVSTNPSPAKTPASTNAAKLVWVDCSAVEGYPIMVKAPEGVKINKTSYGTMGITDNRKFQMNLSKSQKITLESEKKELASNTLNVLKKYIMDESNGILYESEVMGQTQYHFRYFMKVGDGYIEFEDKKGIQYDLESAKLMYNSAKEAKIKGAADGNTKTDELKNENNNLNTAATVAGVATSLAGSKNAGAVTTVAQAVPAVVDKFRKKSVDEKNAENSDGVQEIKDSEGNIAEKGSIINGKKHGRWQYFEKGTLSLETDYVNGVMEGKKIAYAPNGKIEYEETYVAGKKEGIRKKYSISTGNNTEIKNFKNNVLEGEYKRFSDSGELLEEGMYKNNKKDGEWKTYDNKGKLLKSVTYADGKLQQ